MKVALTIAAISTMFALMVYVLNRRHPQKPAAKGNK